MLSNIVTVLDVYWNKAFLKEYKAFPAKTQEDIFKLIKKYAEGEEFSALDFKTFFIDKKVKIQEFRVKDHRGNWRAVSVMPQKNTLVFLYAFHKKAQALSKKDKTIIKTRLKGFLDGKGRK